MFRSNVDATDARAVKKHAAEFLVVCIFFLIVSVAIVWKRLPHAIAYATSSHRLPPPTMRMVINQEAYYEEDRR